MKQSLIFIVSFVRSLHRIKPYPARGVVQWKWVGNRILGRRLGRIQCPAHPRWHTRPVIRCRPITHIVCGLVVIPEIRRNGI